MTAEHPGDLIKALTGTGLPIVEVQAERAAGAAPRGRLSAAPLFKTAGHGEVPRTIAPR